MRHLDIKAILLVKPETVAADHCSCMDDAVLPDLVVGIDLHPSKKHGIVANGAVIVNKNMGIDLHVVSDHNLIADDCEITNVYIFPKPGG